MEIECRELRKMVREYEAEIDILQKENDRLWAEVMRLRRQNKELTVRVVVSSE